VADDRSLSDLIWDYTIYAPIGLAVSIAEELPKLSEKGRERLAGRVQIARVVGKFAVGEAQRRVGRVLADGSAPPRTGATVNTHGVASVPARGSGALAASPAGGLTGSTDALATSPAGGLTGRADASRNGSRAGPAPAATPRTRVVPDAPNAIAGEPALKSAGPDSQAVGPAVASLAIPGYDTLAASQVVKRLGSLRPDELDAIRSYEIATRGRRTILHRIAQLAADR
jgi:hypothetical protein